MKRRRSISAGEAIQLSMSSLFRWSTRADVQKSLRSTDDGLSATDVWLLDHIADAGPFRMSQLADWQSVERATMTTQVRRLEAAALVRRTVDPTDSRAALIEATEQGDAVVLRTRASASQVFDALVDGWSARDRDDLVRLLTALAAGVSGDTVSGDVVSGDVASADAVSGEAVSGDAGDRAKRRAVSGE
jgi:DNA-binding MarR family transcriptional regulator